MIEYTEVGWVERTEEGYEKVIWLSGTIDYQLDGQSHRVDGPARIYKSGSESWYLNDKHHREDGPAVTKPDGYQAWYINDKLHREDGPAVTWPDGTEEYWLNGIQIFPANHHLFSPLQLVKLGLI